MAKGRRFLVQKKYNKTLRKPSWWWWWWWWSWWLMDEKCSKQADVHPVIFQFKRKQCTCASIDRFPASLLGKWVGEPDWVVHSFFSHQLPEIGEWWSDMRKVCCALYISYGAINEEDCYGHQEKSSRWKLSTEEQGPPVRRNTWGSSFWWIIRRKFPHSLGWDWHVW